MFDIIKCKAKAEDFGFENFYFFNDVQKQLLKAENLQAAVKYKSKKSLIMLEDYAFDEGSIKVIAEKKKICFLIDLSSLIKSKGVRRAILMSKLRTFLSLCVRYGAFYTFASFAESEMQIRNPDEIKHIGALIGLNKGQVKFALKMLKHYL